MLCCYSEFQWQVNDDIMYNCIIVVKGSYLDLEYEH
jgi:hypothetical protein